MSTFQQGAVKAIIPDQSTKILDQFENDRSNDFDKILKSLQSMDEDSAVS